MGDYYTADRVAYEHKRERDDRRFGAGLALFILVSLGVAVVAVLVKTWRDLKEPEPFIVEDNTFTNIQWHRTDEGTVTGGIAPTDPDAVQWRFDGFAPSDGEIEVTNSEDLPLPGLAATEPEIPSGLFPDTRTVRYIVDSPEHAEGMAMAATMWMGAQSTSIERLDDGRYQVEAQITPDFAVEIPLPKESSRQP